MSAHYATGTKKASTATTSQPTLAPVLVSFADPAPQSRLTVLVRLFLLLPQFVALALVGVAAYVVMVVGWFCALFTGRLPGFAADFLTGYLRWQTRVYAYALLLTSAYPPFTLGDPDYPVRVAVTPGQLNRLAVLFRFFLLVPCWVILGVLAYGAFTVVQLVSWLIVLIKGKMPDTLHQGLAAVLRYQVRTLGFAAMLTSAYPSELNGDPSLSRPLPARSRRQAQPDGDGQGWRLVLSDRAKALMAGFIVLGVLLVITTGSVAAVMAGVGSGNGTANAASQLTADAAPVSDAVNNYSTNLKSCGGKLNCVTTLDRQVAQTLNTFAGQLRTIRMPSNAVPATAALTSAVAKAAGLYTHLSTAANPNQYISYAKAANVNGALAQINELYGQLTSILDV